MRGVDLAAALQDLLDRVEGGWAAAVGTLDGLLVEGVTRRRDPAYPGPGPGPYLEAALAEHAALWAKARALYAQTLGVDRVEEFWVQGSRISGYVRALPGELLLLLLLGPEANLGRARLMAARLAEALTEGKVWPTSRP